MQEFWREYSPAVIFSIVLHAAMVAAVILAARISLHRTPELIKPLALDAVVIDARTLRPSAPAPVAPPRPVAVPAPAPAPAPEPVKEPVAKAAAQALAAQTQAAEQAKRVADAQKVAEAQKLAEAQRLAEQQQQRAAEAQRVAEAQRAADAKKAAEARAKAEREAEMRRQLADEEHVHEVESGPLSASYYAVLQARVTRAWIKPPSAGAGIDCRIEVTQVPGGEVIAARVTQCNGDAAVRQSIENAVLRASPLPDPPDPALFHRVFTFEFKPDE